MLNKLLASIPSFLPFSFIIYACILNSSLYSQSDYRIKFGKLTKVAKGEKEIIILKNKVRFITRQVKIYTEQITIKKINQNIYLRGKKRVFFLFTNIKGRCKNFRGNLTFQKIVFFHCRLRISLEGKVNIYSFSPYTVFKAKYSILTLINPYFTTCSLPTPHYKVRFGKAYIGLKKKDDKTIIDKLYLRGLKNSLLIVFTGFRKNFYLIKEGHSRKAFFQGIDISTKTRFKRTLTFYFGDTLNFTKNSKMDIKIKPSYSTRRGFFIEYEHDFSSIFLEKKTELFYLNDKIEGPENEFENIFYPPPTRNRYFFHSYGSIFIKGLDTKYELYKISDKNLFQELFPQKFKNEKQAETYLNTQRFIKDNIYIRIFTRPNINPFIEQTQYLPLAKLGILNVKIKDRLYFTSLTTLSYLKRRKSESSTDAETVRATTKNVVTYKIGGEYLDINLYLGIGGNYYTKKANIDLMDKTMFLYGGGIAKPLIYLTEKYQYYGLFELKYTESRDFLTDHTNSAFFDKLDIGGNSGELFFSLRNNIRFGNIEVEYNIYQELYTRNNSSVNQTSFYPFEFPDNFSKTNPTARSHIEDLKFNIGEFNTGIRYENSLGKLFTKKPYLFSIYSEYKKKDRFTIRTGYHVSESIANAIEVYSQWKIARTYYASILLTYYFNEHRIIHSIFNLTKEFHDFYFGLNFSRDELRNEIRFTFTLEPKFREKNILY